MIFNDPFGGLIPGGRGAVLAALLRTNTPLTGRQVHALVSDGYSLWTVQEALKALTQLGVANTQHVGRAGVHTINEGHYSIAPLRALLDPITALAMAVREAADDDVSAVILFGSIARGEAHSGSDIDLAVISAVHWDGRIHLEDTVRARLGNDCDVLTFTTDEFTHLVGSGEPIVDKILADGIALLGSMPQAKRGAA